MSNLIEDILSTVRFRSTIYFKHGFCNPWGMSIPKGDFSQFHLVTSGNCLLLVDNLSIKLDKGDIVIFPRGDAHEIKGQQEGPCKLGVEVVEKIASGKAPFEGKEISTHLICGHFEMDKDLSHPILEKLPQYVLIKSEEYGRFDLMHSAFELIVEEMTQQKPGHGIVSLRLAEILFVSIIRHYYLRQTQEKRNLFKDVLIYNAIDLIHKELAVDWNIERLAREVGISRTLFIERFKKAVGETPIKYITNWRMTKAKYLLKNTKMSVIQIGEKIGYQSETSFNRAFKKQFYISPGKFRLEFA